MFWGRVAHGVSKLSGGECKKRAGDFFCFPRLIDLSHYNPSLIDLMLANISAGCIEPKVSEPEPYLLCAAETHMIVSSHTPNNVKICLVSNPQIQVFFMSRS